MSQHKLISYKHYALVLSFQFDYNQEKKKRKYKWKTPREVGDDIPEYEDTNGEYRNLRVLNILERNPAFKKNRVDKRKKKILLKELERKGTHENLKVVRATPVYNFPEEISKLTEGKEQTIAKVGG